MKIIIDLNSEDAQDVRLDKYLAQLGFARSKIQNKIKKGLITINGVCQKSSYRLKDADVVEFDDDFSRKSEILPEEISLDIVYEDENMLVVNKPSGMLTHPTTQEVSGTLVNALLYRFGENLSDINGNFRRGILHRLDRNTSGLLMVAKNNRAHEFLANQIRDRSARKSYLAVVKGVIAADSGVIDKPISRNLNHPEKMAIVDGGKESITEYKVVERFKDATYLDLNLVTGRTHQIRVHLSSINHPIYNDTLYGAGVAKVKTQEQVLQSYKLVFTKPFADEMIELQIEPDEKIKKVLKYLRGVK